MSLSSCFFLRKSPFFFFLSLPPPPFLTRPATCRIEPRMEMTTQKTVRPNGAGPPREARLRRWTPWAPEANDDGEAAPGAVAALMGVPGCCCCCGSILLLMLFLLVRGRRRTLNRRRPRRVGAEKAGGGGGADRKEGYGGNEDKKKERVGLRRVIDPFFLPPPLLPLWLLKAERRRPFQ